MHFTEGLLGHSSNNVEKITRDEKAVQMSPKEGRLYCLNRLRLVGLGCRGVYNLIKHTKEMKSNCRGAG